MRRRYIFLLFISIVFAFVYRLAFSRFANDHYFDALMYRALAQKIYETGFAVDIQNRTVYYPLFVAILYKIAGLSNDFFVYLIQSLLDIITGCFVYIIGYKLTNNIKSAVVGFALYLVNPLTASYTGLILTEILATFATTLLVLWCLYLLNNQRRIAPWFVWGVIVGFWGFVRLAMFPIALLILFIPLFFHSFNTNKRVVYILCSVIGFVLAMIYPITASYKITGKITPFPSGSVGLFYLYEGYELHRMPELWNQERDLFFTGDIPVSWNYENLPRKEYELQARYVLGLFWEGVKRNPVDYLAWRIRHVGTMWNKTHLFMYEDRFYPRDSMILQIGNGILMLLAGCGWIIVSVQRKQPIGRFFAVFSALLLILPTLFLSLKIPEERLTVPFYPLVMILAGVGLYSGITFAFQYIKKVAIPKIEVQT